MDILTLELYDVSISQGIREVDQVLKEHPESRLRVLMGVPEETLCHNVQRLLERQGRTFKAGREGGKLWIDVDPLKASRPAPVLEPPPPPQLPTAPSPRPALLLRSAFAPGDAFLGRRLLLGVLRTMAPPLPWLGLAHEALELLQDPQARKVLRELQDRGVTVRISSDSLLFHGLDAQPFEILPDEEWQNLLGRGEITVV